jgi:hypothetical protein
MGRTIFFLLFPLAIFGQKTNITGTVADSAGVGLPTASVVLMEERDSVIAQFGTTNKEGVFNLRRIEPGSYLLQISYMGYEAHFQTVTVEAGRPTIELGRIQLLPASVQLGGVDITAEQVPIRFNNDTINYNAAAFRTLPGSPVEELLKKLPGVEVQKDGTIKAQGKTVKSVMVDGKEFFGDDPKIATKNLPADAVENVQIFDKKSEQAEFTGIDDGNEERAINLELKDGAKRGYFGKVTGGYGTKNRYEGKFNVNKFSKNTQVSAIGGTNNINEQGFSLSDYFQAMGGFSALAGLGEGGGEGGGLVFGGMGGGDIPGMGPSLNDGFSDVQSGGLNVNHDFSKSTRLSTNYFYNRTARTIGEQRTRENLLGSAAFNSTDENDQYDENTGHRLNMTLKSKLDSFQQLTVRTKWNLADTYGRENSFGQTNSTDGSIENSNERFYRKTGQNWRGDGSISYKRKLNRRGRSLVADANFAASSNQNRARLVADNRFFFIFDTVYRINTRQRHYYDDDANNWGGGLTLTEGLGRKQFLKFNVSFKEYANTTNKLFYDTLPALPQEVFNEDLSTRFRRGYSYRRAGATYSLQKKRHTFRATAALQQSVLDGQLADSGIDPITFDFKRFLPSASYNFEATTGMFLQANYRTRLREPSLTQLMPVLDNSNPLRLVSGNPNLRPEYTHTLDFNFNRFDMFSGMSFFGYAAAEYTVDKITNAATVDALLRTISQPVNVRNDWAGMLSAEFKHPIRPLKVDINLTMNGQFGRNLLFVNNIENVTKRYASTMGVAFDNRRKKYWDGRVGADFSFNRLDYSENKELGQNFGNQRYFTDVDVTPTPNWVLSSGFDLMVYPQERFGGGDTRIPLWRASITRYVLKGRKGQIKLSAFDLLNQNKGISRSTSFNYAEEVRTRNLARYFMLTFAYSMSGFGASGLTVDIKG